MRSPSVSAVNRGDGEATAPALESSILIHLNRMKSNRIEISDFLILFFLRIESDRIEQISVRSVPFARSREGWGCPQPEPLNLRIPELQIKNYDSQKEFCSENFRFFQESNRIESNGFLFVADPSLARNRVGGRHGRRPFF